MRSVDIEIPTAEGSCDALLALPSAPAPAPALLFYMDGFGLRPVLKAMAERLAELGYVVLLPNLFYRQGRAPLYSVEALLRPENRPKLMELVGSVTPARVLADTAACIGFLDQRAEVRAGAPLGALGYCMGGSLALRVAAAFPQRIVAAASFHGGRLVTDAADSPHRGLRSVQGELYFGHADQDAGMPAEAIVRLEAALAAAGRRAVSELYVGARHGFTMPDLPAYDATACARHWQRLGELLGRALPPG